jgi:membrane protein insertase, YidC/Oxa1 family, C-terminal domain
MNQKIAQIYQTNEVNPLAGCVPSLLQIPIFIGLYRAVLTLAKDDKLNEPFLWLPNLEGPTYGADPAHGADWLFQGWSNGAPMLGWEDTLAFLTIPVVLVLSQSVSMNLMASKDQEQPAFLKFLPLLIGWFSLNVPAALGIYWVANNFITTALTLQIRSTFAPMTPVVPTGKGPVMDVETKTFTPAPIGEKPAGFGVVEKSSDGVKPITPMDAEIVDAGEDVAEVPSDSPKPKRGKGKKKKGKRN